MLQFIGLQRVRQDLATEQQQLMWVGVESVTQSEVSQKEKNKYCILIHIYTESRKMVQMNLFAGKK